MSIHFLRHFPKRIASCSRDARRTIVSTQGNSCSGRATPIVFETLQDGDIVGASWLVPPYRWMFDARAVGLTRAIGMDAACLRGKCEADHHLGYEMMKRFLPILVGRLHATRLQILDVYGKH